MILSAVRRKEPASAARELALAVIQQALHDLRAYRSERGRKRRFYTEAVRWVLSDDRTWPYSFLNLCDLLDLHSDTVRRQLLRPRDIAAVAADWVRAAGSA